MTTNVADMKTKGNAVISPAQVLEARTYLFNNPGTSAAKVHEAVGMDHMSLQAFDRTLRGIYHSHLDMHVRVASSPDDVQAGNHGKTGGEKSSESGRAG